MILMKDAGINLQLLHDDLLRSIEFDSSDPQERRLTVVLESAETGARMRIVARGVYLFRCTARGHARGSESINAWDEGVSPATAAELAGDRAAGYGVPASAFTVTFHSGSHFELVCDRLEFEYLS